MDRTEQFIALRESQLARRINLAKVTLRGWRREGKGPRYVRVGRTILYPLEAVQSWLEANKVGANQ